MKCLEDLNFDVFKTVVARVNKVKVLVSFNIPSMFCFWGSLNAKSANTQTFQLL